MSGKHSKLTFLLIAVVGFLTVCPVVMLVFGSFSRGLTASGQFTLAKYIAAYSDPAPGRSIAQPFYEGDSHRCSARDCVCIPRKPGRPPAVDPAVGADVGGGIRRFVSAGKQGDPARSRWSDPHAVGRHSYRIRAPLSLCGSSGIRSICMVVPSPFLQARS